MKVTEQSSLLPRTYIEMVSDADIIKINSVQQHYSLIRNVKKCGLNRIHFDHKGYTWDLQLQRV